jgi:hypothetical protein
VGYAVLCFGTDEVISGCDFTQSYLAVAYLTNPVDGDSFINNIGTGPNGNPFPSIPVTAIPAPKDPGSATK